MLSLAISPRLLLRAVYSNLRTSVKQFYEFHLNASTHAVLVFRLGLKIAAEWHVNVDHEMIQVVRKLFVVDAFWQKYNCVYKECAMTINFIYNQKDYSITYIGTALIRYCYLIEFSKKTTTKIRI